MGEVWLAEDPTGAAGGAPRRVALKLLDPGLVDDPASRARFAREVDAARRVRGPSVAALLDADVGAARPWLASAYVAGPTVEEHVARHGPLAAGALRALGAALAEALVSIHGAGVVHRDLTPRNVVLGPDGPRVVDFGIAWFPDAAPITQVGSWVGTPAWMPPERLTSDETTAASDVWSWGAVMAYAARGRPAVGGSTPQVAAHRAAQGAVDLAGVPAWLTPVVRAALAPDPATRPTAAQLEAAMAAAHPDWPSGRETVREGPPPGDDTIRAGWPPAEETVREGPPPGDDTVRDARPGQVGARPDRTVPHPAAPTRAYGDGGRGASGASAPPGGRRGIDRRVARWGSAAVVLGLAVAVGVVAQLLVTIIVVAVLVVVAVGLRFARERLPDGARPVPPTWAFALAGPTALGVGLGQVLGPVGGAAAVLGLVVLFFVVGGDIG
jgi:hypothetical protein